MQFRRKLNVKATNPNIKKINCSCTQQVLLSSGKSSLKTIRTGTFISDPKGLKFYRVTRHSRQNHK